MLEEDATIDRFRDHRKASEEQRFYVNRNDHTFDLISLAMIIFGMCFYSTAFSMELCNALLFLYGKSSEPEVGFEFVAFRF